MSKKNRMWNYKYFYPSDFLRPYKTSTICKYCFNNHSQKTVDSKAEIHSYKPLTGLTKLFFEAWLPEKRNCINVSF